MKIAYVSTFDARFENSWSGTGYHIAKALENQGAEICYVGPLAEKNALYYKAKQLFYREILKKRHIRQAEPAILRFNAEQISKQIQNFKPDIVLGIWSYPISHLKCTAPIAFIADATFPIIKDFYQDYTNLSTKTIQNSFAMERAALENCAAVLYSSQWAAQSAIHDYGTPSNKVHVVSFGANIDTDRTQEDIDTLISNRNNPLKLLFVGVDWLRKGGAKALEVTTILNERGIETELHIVGSSPPIDRLPTYVHLHGFLKKTDPIEAKKITSLFDQSHFLILPSSADCTPIVFSEANSFGVPCISTDVGGITSVIKNNINGYAFDLDASAEKYADYIQEKSKDESVYRSLAQSSFLEYKNRLNWETAGLIMMKIFENLVKK